MPNDARRVISRRLLFKNKEQNVEEEITMEYLIVTGVVLVMAFYVVIIARCLKNA